MNYKKLYFNIIRNRRNNPLPAEEYGEVHHIKPKSFGRSGDNLDDLDDKKNLIRLSAREHFIVHFLLYKIYKHRSENVFQKSKRELERYKKMTWAFNIMINAKSKSQKRLNKNINNRVFEQLRKTIADQQTQYSFELVKAMFDFYVVNNLSPNTINVLNKQFDNNITYNAFKKLLYKHDLKITEHQKYKRHFNRKRQYSIETVKQMFNFYAVNNLTPDTIGILNKQFNTNLSYKQLNKMFCRDKLKLKEHSLYIVPKNNIRYSLNEIQNMFEFYIDNNLSPKQMDIFNKEFNVNFNYLRLKGLFNRNGFKISQSKNKLNHDKC